MALRILLFMMKIVNFIWSKLFLAEKVLVFCVDFLENESSSYKILLFFYTKYGVFADIHYSSFKLFLNVNNISSQIS